MLNLSKALRLAPDACIALVGAGGKTTALFKLARELPPPVLLAATTHMADRQLALSDHHFVVAGVKDVDSAMKGNYPGVLLFTGPHESDERLSGLGDEAVERLCSIAQKNKLPLFIESDGSRQLPLKAPVDHEPALPFIRSGLSSSYQLNAVVVVVGLSGLGKPLQSKWVHRVERFAELSGLDIGANITVDAVANVLAHPQGGLKRIPSGTRRILLLNQADSPELQAIGQGLANRLVIGSGIADAYHAAIVSSLKSNQVYAVHEPTAGVILAAGGASRFGRPKQLLDWEGEPLVRRSARIAKEAGLDPVVVVTGAYAEQIRSSLTGLDIQQIENPNWSEGMSTSVRVGVSSLPAYTGGVVFMLVDQPFVQADLVRMLVEHHSQSLDPIIGPVAGGQRANPVLFDRDTFQDLLRLDGDRGGRQLFSRYSPAWVPWHDERILREIDTPEDYQLLQDLLRW